MDHDDDGDRLSDDEAGWECTRLLALARATAARAELIQDQLQAFDAARLQAEDGAALEASELDQIVSDTFALQDDVDAMGFIANRLHGREETLMVTADEVRTEAARALAAGSADLTFVMLAAGMLRTAEGFPALADAITAEAAITAEWSEITVGALLATFVDGDAPRTSRVCGAAGFHPDVRMSSLDFETTQRLADALRTTDA